MDLPPAWSQACVCGRAFSLPQAYTFHQRSCQRTKKRLLGALEKAKDILQASKRRKVESVIVTIFPTLFLSYVIVYLHFFGHLFFILVLLIYDYS